MVNISQVSKSRVYADGDSMTADNYNDDRDEVIAGVNSITNAQVAAAAAIAYSKLNLTGNVLNADIATAAAIAASKISGTAMTLSSTDTVTGAKTFAKTVQTITTATDGATVTFDLSKGNIHEVTLGGNRTLALSNVSVGQCFIIRLIQDGTGSRTATWFSTIRWFPSAPTLTTTASKIDALGFICTGTNTYDGFIVGQGG